ncbi:F-actin capping protein beta subunit Acp2 [Schizosaccharomyces osmophilus]|uniref:F-actin-capping protein subunit beta n=1 Tax=Schizosaccharomyces osmophilus TaxID=2545709 RepID=A0AAF0AVM1_9SCHI|nr:F-actin capping protein beta subunit Acp2 [Schizosaccharomyces osmophilus]WBW73711.1 F-actin capping protein beta subunit Acp2 [Schizosaccharomyces osmophilus]
MLPEDAALDLLRRLNPKDISKNLDAILAVAPDLADVLLSSVDQPLQVSSCSESGNQYLLCDFNRDGDSYRSPWTNKYDPPLEDGLVSSDRVRKLESDLNEAMRVYLDLYYEGGVSSVYLWDQDDSYAGAVLIKKASSSGSCGWDSIHVFECLPTSETDVFDYRLTSTIILYLGSDQHSSLVSGALNLSGHLTRQTSQRMPASEQDGEVGNIGRLVEEMETRMRNFLQEVYFDKTRDIINQTRSMQPISENPDKMALRSVLKNLSN